MSERDRIEQALTFDTGCEPSAQEIIDALNRAGYQITPGPGYDHSGNDNHLVAGDHGPVITPQAGAEPVAWMVEADDIDESRLESLHFNKREAVALCFDDEEPVPLYRTAPPSPVAPVWQPIETAPRDGTEVLLLFPDGRRHIGLWGVWRDSSYPAIWQNQYGDALVRPWKEYDEEPTHWQPLPSPPDSPGAGKP